MHKVREMGTPLQSGRLATLQGVWSIEEIELCLGVGWHSHDVVRGSGANKADT